MSYTITVETIDDINVIQQALERFIQLGYQEMDVDLLSDPESLNLAIKWDKKIDTAKRLQKSIVNGLS